MLRHFGLRLEDIGQVIPMGAMVHNHVTPSDHLMVWPRDLNAARAHYDVVTPVCQRREGRCDPTDC